MTDTHLAPVPQPGLAIFPALMATGPETLVMKGEHFGSGSTITDNTGMAIFQVDPAAMSMSRRTVILDQNGRRLCTVRAKQWSSRAKYYGEVEEDGPHLFDLERHGFTGFKFSISFPNAAANGQTVQLDYKSNRWVGGGVVSLAGVPVAVFEPKSFKLRKETHMRIAPGVDKFVIVALLVCLNSIRRKANAAAGAGIGAAAGGGGGG